MGKFNDRRDRDRQMFKTTCSNCGKTCEVPFQPRGDKPVYCDDCFRKKRDSEPKRHDVRVSETSELKTQLQAVNAKLDKILLLLETTKPEQPLQVIIPEETIDAPTEAEKKPAKKKAKAAKKTEEAPSSSE